MRVLSIDAVLCDDTAPVVDWSSSLVLRARRIACGSAASSGVSGCGAVTLPDRHTGAMIARSSWRSTVTGRLRDLFRRWQEKRRERRLAAAEALKSLHDEPGAVGTHKRSGHSKKPGPY